jgi:putative colanic acid biosynthesis acetyltransferase WcaF
MQKTSSAIGVDGSTGVQQLRSFKLPANFRGGSALIVQMWWLVQATAFRWSPQFLYGFRRQLLRMFGASVGERVLIRPTVKVTYPWKVTIEDDAWIGDDVTLYSLGEIIIGHDAVISQKSYLCTGSHDTQSSSFDIFSKPIVIGPMAWIATDVFVAPGITVGEGTVVGVRSTVLKDLPAYMVCFGNPAAPVKSR